MNNYIHPKAKLAAGVKIGHFSVIHEDVEIGEGTWVGSNVTIFPGARIGKNCKIFPSSTIAAVPQDLKFDEEYTTAVIGDHTTIRECVTINRGTKASGTTIVGSHCLIMACAHVAHDCVLKSHVVLANSVALAGHVEVGNHVVIGGLSGVHQFVRIGDHVMLSANSLAKKDIPPFITVSAGPSKFAGVNSTGLGRRSFSSDEIEAIGSAYDLIYGGEYNATQALQKVKLMDRTPHTDLIINFIEGSKRGILLKR